MDYKPIINLIIELKAEDLCPDYKEKSRVLFNKWRDSQKSKTRKKYDNNFLNLYGLEIENWIPQDIEWGKKIAFVSIANSFIIQEFFNDRKEDINEYDDNTD